jgi:hypothetical protein
MFLTEAEKLKNTNFMFNKLFSRKNRAFFKYVKRKSAVLSFHCTNG